MCYYFDDIINGTKISFSNILLDKRLYENILHKTQVVPKTLRMRFDKMNGFMMVHDGKLKHLVSFGYGLADKIFHEIKCLISKKKKKMVLQKVLIIIFKRSKLIDIVLCLLKNINFS